MTDTTRIGTDAAENSAATKTAVRRYDIDWLRVILFSLLIGYHFAWLAPPHYSFGESLPYRFVFGMMHEWRLAALFVISGMGTAFAFRRRTWQAYLKERGTRLLVPLLFAVYFLNGAWLNPVEAMHRLLTFSARPDVLQHMWFVYNLLIYSVLLTPLFQYVRRNPDGKFVRAVGRLLRLPYGTGIMLVPPLLLALIALLPGSWGAGIEGFWWYLLFFTFGYLLLMNSEAYFAALEPIRLPVTIATPILLVLFLLAAGSIETWHVSALTANRTLVAVIQAIHAWFWCLFLFSWATVLLNRPSRPLAYLNQAIYPVFIVHLPLTRFIVFLFGSWAIFTPFKDLILGPLLVLSGALLIFEIVKRARFARVAFGIKLQPQQSSLEISNGVSAAKPILFHALTIIIIILLNWGSWLYWGWALG